MSPTFVSLMTLVSGIGAVTGGWRMTRQPQAYLGHGVPPSTDLRTVLFFGRFALVLGVVVTVVSVFQLAGGRLP